MPLRAKKRQGQVADWPHSVGAKYPYGALMTPTHPDSLEPQLLLAPEYN